VTKELEGKTALVTGGSRGLGRGMAIRLAASGAIIAVNYAENKKAADEVVATVTSAGGQAFAVQAALGDPTINAKFIGEFMGEFKKRTGREKLDILINNIGGGGYAPFPTETVANYDHTFSNNVRAPFFLTQALLPYLTDGGRVINIGSTGSRLVDPNIIVYSMAKAALDKFTEVLAKELGPRRITVNAVLPGFNATDVNMPMVNDPAMRKYVEENTLLGRFGEASDIAEVVHFFALPASGWVTGQMVEASGGFKW
jgi:NAD(P)-dependent dehydrogenase (short-subunit alcohol dehydrogenase family)